MNGAKRRNELVAFIKRVLKRNPELERQYAQYLAGAGAAAGLEAVAPRADDLPTLLQRSPLAALETIVSEERPVLFIEKDGLNFKDAAVIGAEARRLMALSETHRDVAERMLDRVGRIDLIDFPGGAPFAGTGWLIDAGIIVTNRHVADAFARLQGRAFVFRQGSTGGPMGAAWDTGHLRDKAVTGLRRQIAEVLYIEPEDGPNDIAFLKLASTGAGDELPPFEIAPSDAKEEALVFTLGYPAKASQDTDSRSGPDGETLSRRIRREALRARFRHRAPLRPDHTRLHDLGRQFRLRRRRHAEWTRSSACITPASTRKPILPSRQASSSSTSSRNGGRDRW